MLTLDIGLQQIAQHALKNMRGAVVVMDAKDGGILALYSNPTQYIGIVSLFSVAGGICASTTMARNNTL